MSRNKQEEIFLDPYSSEEMELAERLRQSIINPGGIEVFPLAEVHPIRSTVIPLGQYAIGKIELQTEEPDLAG